jgi:sortase (surface protein transpeptidase)
VGYAFILLTVVVLGLVAYLYGLSGVQEARAQTTMYEKLQGELANQVAPLGPTTPGNPVAILDIPSVGVHDMVVVQGTSPQTLTLGPGHLRDTPLPGQAGVVQLFGRRASFGGPFARVPSLRPGDIIGTVTGQGRSIYRVAALGSSWAEVRNPAPNQLILITASSPYVPAYYSYVDANLVSTAHPGPTASRAMSSSEIVLANDPGALVLTLMWALALALVSVVGSVAASRWSPWAAYLATAPVALAVLWNLYQNLSMLLPNVY